MKNLNVLLAYALLYPLFTYNFDHLGKVGPINKFDESEYNKEIRIKKNLIGEPILTILTQPSTIPWGQNIIVKLNVKVDGKNKEKTTVVAKLKSGKGIILPGTQGVTDREGNAIISIKLTDFSINGKLVDECLGNHIFRFEYGSSFVESKNITVSPAVGWSSLTGFRNALSSVQISVVKAAKKTGSSGSSFENVPGCLTDCAGGDGDRMRKAINIYATWFNKNIPVDKRCISNVIPSNVTTDMDLSLTNSSGCPARCYSKNSRTLLINRIVFVYNQKACENPSASIMTPIDNQSILDFLGIRRQCLEWVVTIGKNAGGEYISYDSGAVPSSIKYRPGMALLKNDRSHAMIIIDINWDQTGNPVKFKIAEVNYGTGWENPSGMVPWMRTQTIRDLNSISGCKVVSFEN